MDVATEAIFRELVLRSTKESQTNYAGDFIPLLAPKPSRAKDGFGYAFVAHLLDGSVPFR